MIDLAIAAAMLVAPAQATATPVALDPVGPWTVQAEDSLCLLSRQYGAGSDKLTIGFQQLFGDSGQIHIISPRDKPRKTDDKAKVRFFPGDVAFEGSYYSFLIAGGQRMTRIELPREAFEQLAKSEEMAFDARPVTGRVRIGRSAKAIATYDNCENDLLESWGIDPKALSSDRVSRPERDPAKLFDRHNYPRDAVRNGQIGRVIAVLKVEADGKVGACHVATGAGKALNEATCRQASKIVFSPATNASGNPIPSVHVLPVRWILEE